MSVADLLIELGTEELPPKALLTLRDALVDEVVRQLDEAGFAHAGVERFAAPRRLAFRIRQLALRQPDRELERRGPAVQAAFDKEGSPTKALEGFAQSAGVAIDQLERLTTDKGEWLVARSVQPGLALEAVIQGYLEQAVHKLPIPKRMHWGRNRAQFVRPVHWLVALLDDKVVPVTLLGLTSDRLTRGHRFHHPDQISLAHASDYEQALQNVGKVMPVFEQRRKLIAGQATQLAEQEGGTIRMLPALLDEVTALVEWPVPLVAHFESRFLRVPQEALIATMESDQKYFSIMDDQGRLKNAFVFVSNIDSRDPAQVIAGNEKVVRPRLSDAEFFYDVDCKKTLAQHAEPLKQVVFQQQLGTVAEKSARVAKLAGIIAAQLQGDRSLAEQAGLLAKADLTTGMVGEFDNMQGVMGRYLAINEGLPDELAQAIEEQYLPRFSGDALPVTVTGQALALADKLFTLVGIFGIGQKPTGDKDPFALRRAALGMLRIIIECQLPLDLKALVDDAARLLSDRISAETSHDVMEFLVGRYRSFYQEQGFDTRLIQAATGVRPELPLDLDRRLRALAEFQQQPACAALAAANKRVANILAKQQGDVSAKVDQSLLQEPAEKTLAQVLAQQASVVDGATQADYLAQLNRLAALREPVDAFFEQVMVNAEDPALRQNRLALLAALRGLFLEVADISLLD